jgi:hypothetical protein
MLKSVSSVANALGSLNYKGTWNAATNTPTIVSSVGTKGDYYVVSVDGNTNINGISNWGVGDWIVFNGAVWQRVEGGADVNAVNLTVTGTTDLNGFTSSADGVFTGTGQVTLPVGTTLERSGTPAAGMLRFNDDNDEFEGYDGTAWGSIGGGTTISNDTTTSTDVYPLFADATSGDATTVYTSNAKLLYKPSTGELKAFAPVATNGIMVNATTMTQDYTIATGTNGLSVGPFTIDSGVTLTIDSGQRHLIL